jgi:hypothetical protein
MISYIFLNTKHLCCFLAVEGSLKVGGDAEDDACREMRHSAEISEKRQLLTWKTNKQLKKAHQTLEELKRTVSLKVSLPI